MNRKNIEENNNQLKGENKNFNVESQLRKNAIKIIIIIIASIEMGIIISFSFLFGGDAGGGYLLLNFIRSPAILHNGHMLKIRTITIKAIGNQKDDTMDFKIILLTFFCFTKANSHFEYNLNFKIAVCVQTSQPV